MNEVALPSPLERSLARLARSRLSLRTAMLPQKDRLDAERGDGAVLPRRLRAWLRSGPLASLTRALEPWIGDAQRTLRRWWRRHPWRPSVEVVMDLAERNVVSWVQRNPVAAIALGAVAGVALVAAAPWRSTSVRRVVGNSSRHARRWALHQLASPAAQTVIAGLITSWLAAAPAAADTAGRHTEPAHPRGPPVEPAKADAPAPEPQPIL